MLLFHKAATQREEEGCWGGGAGVSELHRTRLRYHVPGTGWKGAGEGIPAL